MERTRSAGRRAIVAALASLMALSIVFSASAHERREVGEFEFVVGFINEPAVVDELNGIDLRISRPNGEGEDGEPIENADQTLSATISYGEETTQVELRPVFGQPGAYTADIIPTVTGAYTFQFTGEIDGQEINETFRSGPDTFSEVESRDALQFPNDPPQAADDTDQAMAIGIAGVVAGLLGLIAGVGGYFKASNATTQPGQSRERRARQGAGQSPPTRE